MRKEYIAVIVVVVSILFLFYLTTTHLSATVEGDRQNIDSLNSEISALSIDNTRYELILERVWEIDSNVIIEATKNIE